MVLNFAVVEDEEFSADTLIGFINRYCEEKNIQANIYRFSSATALLKNYKPIYDIIFMDIILPNLNGMNAATRLRALDENVILIFVTNMANLAVKGYEVNALDFIIKPVVYNSFVMKMSRAISVAQKRQSIDIKIQMDGAIKIISASKIHYIEVKSHNLIYHTEEGNYSSRDTLSRLEKQLESKNFFRCNVCYLVNLKYISEINGDNVTVANDILKISRARKKEFLQVVTNYFGKNV